MIKRGIKQVFSFLFIISMLFTLFSTSTLAAENNYSITLKELKDLQLKYGFSINLADENVVSDDIIQTLSKGELEKKIQLVVQQSSEPVIVNVYEEIKNVITLDNEFIKSTVEQFNPIITPYGIIVKDAIYSLSKNVQVFNNDFIINGTVAASYQYSWWQGSEGYVTMFYTGVSDGGSVQVNSPNTGYALKEVMSSSASYTSDYVTKTARYKYDWGIYVDIGGQPIGITISPNQEVTVNYYWHIGVVPKPWY